MSYRYSHLDNSNINWFREDNSVQTLTRIHLNEGNIRGLSPFKINFTYPLSAIAGENGSGKSTLLALAACAFHNSSTNFKPDDRKTTYYTFSDFFIQTHDEIPPDGISIAYFIRHNRWRVLQPGEAFQERKKTKGGKWNSYASRVRRNVIHFGTLRVVPPNELKTHRSYCRLFKIQSIEPEIAIKIKTIAGRIIGKTYDDFHIYEYTKFKIPAVTIGTRIYTGFNMGAGEKAVFSILYSLLRAGKGSLLVIDEIELGLHAKAQKKLILELKELCNELHCQIICSTHSSVILDSLPPEGRFFIETNNSNTTIIPKISAEYACGKLSGESSRELSIFVEDDMAESIIQNTITYEMRRRIELIKIGSDEAISRQVAARIKEQKINFISFLDGDKRKEKAHTIKSIKNYLEKKYPFQEDDLDKILDTRLQYIPGTTWPEKVLLHRITEDKLSYSKLSGLWKIQEHLLPQIIHEALNSGKHNEFYILSDHLKLDLNQVRRDIINVISEIDVDFFDSITNNIQQCFLKL
jgi:predicted ATPase